MEVLNGRTTVWVPREEFEALQRLWKPEFTWIPVPVDRSLPPDRIAYIETNGPVSPLPSFARDPPTTPLSPLSPLPPPRTPVTLAPLDTASLRAAATLRAAAGPDALGGGSAALQTPELETAVTAGFSPADWDAPSTPTTATATEPGSPSTPRDVVGGPKLSSPRIWRQSKRFSSQQAGDGMAKTIVALPEVVVQAPAIRIEQPPLAEVPQQNFAADPWKMYENSGDKWKMVDPRNTYRPANPGVKQASWKWQNGHREVKMDDHWHTFKRDEAHWNGSKKGFALRFDVNLEMKVEIKGFVNGDITLSAEALHYNVGEAPFWM